MNGVRFGNIHTYDEWKLILTSADISFPDIKTEKINIPGTDGELDFTESLTNDVKYKNRKITFNFVMVQERSLWTSLMSTIANYLHGKDFKIILDNDLNFFYKGRTKVNEFKSDKSIGRIVIEADVDPYKYDLISSEEDWLWDPFNFESGIINETKELNVEGELTVNIYGRRKLVSPKFIIGNCKNDIQCVFEGQTYNFISGVNYAPNIQIKEGKNTFKFIGIGTVTIEYRGGSL